MYRLRTWRAMLGPAKGTYSQRIVCSEAAMRGWDICTTGISKAFLQGVTYEEPSRLTGEPVREVNFYLPTQSVPLLRHGQGFEDVNEQLEVLHSDKPGTGLVDASMKLAMITIYGEVSDDFRGNNVLRRTQQLADAGTHIRFCSDVDEQNFMVGLVTGVSSGGQLDGGSQCGYAIVLGSANMATQERVRTALVDWGSTKIRRVVKSTLAAEACRCSTGYDRAVYIRASLSELLGSTGQDLAGSGTDDPAGHGGRRSLSARPP